MAKYGETKSDEWIWEKLVKHKKATGDEDRDLIRQKLDNGYNDEGESHCIYYLHGSPIKGYALRRRNEIHFYDKTGKRWGTYRLNGKPPIEHDMSKKNQDLLQEVKED